MVKREAEKLLRSLAKQFRAVAVVGPRQSGKTTLVKEVFPRKPYVSLEDPDERLFATQDARAFLSRYPKGAIIDEVQRVPELFSYLQKILDNTRQDGLFILTGSNNFLLQENISQTLAGRVGYIDLLPFTYAEVTQYKKNLSTDELILNGFYPEIYDRQRKPGLWYPAYIRTYIERDVKQIKNISNTILFNKFLKLCAGRTSQQINLSALSSDAGVDIKTVQSWISILESSFVIFLLAPYHKNFNKRLVKTSKLYFYDTGLACSLLGIKSSNEVSTSHFKGALFENLVIAECLKQRMAKGLDKSISYWRDNKGVEIDLVLQTSREVLPIEIKSAKTFANDFVRNIHVWNDWANNKGGLVVFDGDAEMERSNNITVSNWKNMKINKR